MKYSIKIGIKNIAFYLSVVFFLVSSNSVFSASSDIKMVVTAAFVSENGLPVYKKISEYLSKKLSRKVNLVSGITYKESDLLLGQGIVQVGFICGLPYTQKTGPEHYSLIAMPVMAMKKGTYPDAMGYEEIPGKYYSYTIVHKDSPIKSWQELKGKTFVYNDQNSNSGYNMPRYKLIQLGMKSWEDYFSAVHVSGSHEESIRMVAEKRVDASSVDSLVLDYDRHIGNAYASQVKIIEHLFPGGAGIPPVVLSSRADPGLRLLIQKVLIDMHKDPEGKLILEQALISHFAVADDSNYDDIRKMNRAAKDAGFKDHQLRR